MVEKKKIKIGIDFDGVIVKLATGLDPRRALKAFLPNIPEVIEQINFLKNQDGVDVLGIYTTRPNWLRGWQTAFHIRKTGIPVERVVYTANSHQNKIKALLLDAAGLDKDSLTVDKAQIAARNMGEVVLIDDSILKAINGARKLYKLPEMRPLIERLTLVAFNVNQKKVSEAVSDNDPFRVIFMRGWADTQQMLDKIRNINGEI